MIKITLFCVFLTYVIQSSVAAPAKINLATASQDEVFRFFPNATDITIERLSAEQADALNQFAKEKDLNIEEALVLFRVVLRGLQYKAEGKPLNSDIIEELFCSELKAAPLSSTNKPPVDLQEYIINKRSQCEGPISFSFAFS